MAGDARACPTNLIDTGPYGLWSYSWRDISDAKGTFVRTSSRSVLQAAGCWRPLDGELRSLYTVFKPSDLSLALSVLVVGMWGG